MTSLAVATPIAANDDVRPGLEIVSGETIGRDPRRMSAAELAELGHSSNSLIAAIREKCLDCCAGQSAEVRKCVATACSLWPFRMGSNPLARRTVSDEQREAMRARASAARAKLAASLAA